MIENWCRLAVLFLSITLLRNVVLAAEDIAEPLPFVDVEAQPLGANIKRLDEALRFLGTPLGDDVTEALRVAVEQRDAKQIQKAIDRLCAFFLQINPEERVKVRRGPAPISLQQHGFTPVLLKIENLSTSTKRLRIGSPQAGTVYAGVAKLSMQRQQSLELIENENIAKSRDRFLSVAMFDQPPMMERLSGLELEYAIALLLSTEAGKREATIGFDLGQGEQDLGFRGEVPVLFTAKPAIPVRLSIKDEDGSPTTASLVIRDKQGHIYPLQAKRLAPDFFFQPQIYRADGETVLLPPGDFTIEYGRGPEYLVLNQSVKIDSPAIPNGSSDPKEAPAISLSLRRWVNPLKVGYYSGDHHIHAAGCSHYTQPTEGVTPEDMFRQVKGEGLNVGCVLTWGPCFAHQRQFFAPKPHNVSEPLTLLKYDLEISGFGSQALGHICLLNLRDQTYPGSEGTDTKGWPTWTTPTMRWAKAQGGVTGYAHSASGLAIEPNPATKRLIVAQDKNTDGKVSVDEAANALLPEPFDKIDKNGDRFIDESELLASHQRVSDSLPNLAIPEMNGVGAMEICVSTAEGVCDFISAMDTRRIQEWNTWYHLLNCGFPLKVSGETDFPCMSSRRVGQGRVYVDLGQDNPRPLDFEAWCDGLARGRSYVSDGFAHALDFRVNSQRPGFDDVQLKLPESVLVTATVVFAPETPATVAQGLAIPAGGKKLVGDTVDLHGPRLENLARGGDRLIEVVVNGEAVDSQVIPADGQAHQLRFEIPVTRSSWVALRHFPQLHTNPVNVIVTEKPIRASRDSAVWCEKTIEQLWKNRQNKIVQAERDEAFLTFERAKSKYRTIAAECFSN